MERSPSRFPRPASLPLWKEIEAPLLPYQISEPASETTCYSPGTLKTPRPVLWVVPNQLRLKQLQRIASQEAQALKDDPTIFFLTTRSEVNEHTLLFAPIWTVADGPDKKALFDQATVSLRQNSKPLNT